MAPRERPPYSSDRSPFLDGMAASTSRALALRSQQGAAAERAKRTAAQERQEKLARQKTGAPASGSALRVKVVDEQSGSGVVDVRLEATVAEGVRKPLATARGGIAELLDLEPGAYEVSSPLAGARLANTLAITSGRASETAGEPRAAEGPFVLAHVEEHKVRTGETLASVASAHGLSERDLAIFNFGAEPSELDPHLRDELGCTKKDADGHYVFDDTDAPGILYVPKPWTAKLEGGRLHDLRVRRIERKLPALRLWYQLETQGQFAKNDLLTLEADDGSWKHELAVGGLKEVEPGWVELVFPDPPAGVRYHLVQDPRDGLPPFHVFKGASYGDLRAAALGDAAA